MSDPWENIKAVKSKRNSIREKLQKRKTERQHLLSKSNSVSSAGNNKLIYLYFLLYLYCVRNVNYYVALAGKNGSQKKINEDSRKIDVEIESSLLEELSNISQVFPITSIQLLTALRTRLSEVNIAHAIICNLLSKFSLQNLIR